MTVELEATLAGISQSERWDIEDAAARAGVDATTLVRAYVLLRDVWRAHDDVADELRALLEDAEGERDTARSNALAAERENDDLERERNALRAELATLKATLE